MDSRLDKLVEPELTKDKVKRNMIMALIFLIPVMLMHGYMIQKSWEWFISPLGLPTIGFWHAMGIGIIVAYITQEFSIDGTNNPTRRLYYAMMAPFVAFAFAFIYHLLM